MPLSFNKLGRPTLSKQSITREIIKKKIVESGRSTRSIATSIGLKGHASLSRFLQGRQRLSFETIVELCNELGIEGHDLEKIARSLIPEKLLSALNHSARTQDEKKILTRIKLPRFFYNYNTPIIYETLKILGRPSLEQVLSALHRKLFIGKDEIIICLTQLEEMGLVAKENNIWRVINRKNDIVIPSKYSMEFGKRVIEKALLMNQKFIAEPTSARMMRSLLTTVRKTKTKNAIDHLRQLIMNFQDDVFGLQSDTDNTVVSVFISAVEVSSGG